MGQALTDANAQEAPSWEEAMMIDLIRSMRKDRNALLRAQDKGKKGKQMPIENDEDLD